MSGGLLRVATEVRALRDAGPAIVLDTGDLVAGVGRQDVLKAETISQAFAALKVTAINVTAGDARLGTGEWLSLSRLADGRFLSSQVGSDSQVPLTAEVRQDGYLIGGFSTQASQLGHGLGTAAEELEPALSRFLEEAKGSDLIPVVMLDGTQEEAVAVAKRHPEIALLTYQITGRAPRKKLMVGPVQLVAPGERGEDFVSFTLQGRDLDGYVTVHMGPDVKDDAPTKKLYDLYLREVAREGLWAKTDRLKGPAYSGSEKCGECHRAAYKVWAVSDHAKALHTLAVAGHDQDPECIVCHVTGAAYRSGFQSEGTTPSLGRVGCESCHGAGAAHSAHPYLVPMRKTTSEQCISCHRPLNSPKFEFAKYWAKVRH